MRLPTFFTIALPDSDRASSIARKCEAEVNTRLYYPSGRPWLLARARSEEVVASKQGDTQVVLLGASSAKEADLARIARDISTVSEVPYATSTFQGNFSVFAAKGREMMACGTVFQSRRIFYADVQSVGLVADRADVLAQLGGFAINDELLAIKLLTAEPDAQTSNKPVWLGVHSVPGGSFCTQKQHGPVVVRKWWEPPTADLNRQEGAERLRESLENAVAVRTAMHRKVACDLSGGMDSTPLCYFAAKGASTLTAITYYNDDPGGREDLRWAQKALQSMPGVAKHSVLSIDKAPAFYQALDKMRVRLDEPTAVPLAAPRMEYALEQDVEEGITAHINGAGGDHLFRGTPVWNHTLARSHPLVAWRRQRATALASGSGVFATLRQLLDNTTYSEWLDRISSEVSRRNVGSKDTFGISAADWYIRPTVPLWLTRDAVALAVSCLGKAALESDPLSKERRTHFDMANILDATRVARSASIVGRHHGISYDAPLMDDGVITSVLSVKYDQRDNPLEWKPLIKSAMKGLLPADYLERTTKIGGGTQAIRGYKQHYSEIVSVIEDSGLIEKGLVDRAEFLRYATPSETEAPDEGVDKLLNVAIFLNNLRDGSAAGSD